MKGWSIFIFKLKSVRTSPYQHLVLGLDVLLLLRLLELLLLEHLQGVDLAVVLLLHQDHLRVGAEADDGQHQKTVQRDLLFVRVLAHLGEVLHLLQIHAVVAVKKRRRRVGLHLVCDV